MITDEDYKKFSEDYLLKKQRYEIIVEGSKGGAGGGGDGEMGEFQFIRSSPSVYVVGFHARGDSDRGKTVCKHGIPTDEKCVLCE